MLGKGVAVCTVFDISTKDEVKELSLRCSVLGKGVAVGIDDTNLERVVSDLISTGSSVRKAPGTKKKYPHFVLGYG